LQKKLEGKRQGDRSDEDSGIEVKIKVIYRAEKEQRARSCQCLDEISPEFIDLEKGTMMK
jgi:hypothetical protein